MIGRTTKAYKKYINALLIALFLLLSASHAVNLPDFSVTQKKAERGDAQAQYDLGTMYYGGVGVAKDHDQAAVWYLKAAERGLTIAQSNIGLMYQNGDGVAQDIKQAEYWLRKAAAGGSSAAKSELSPLYRNNIYDQFAMTNSRRAIGENYLEVLLEETVDGKGKCDGAFGCSELGLVFTNAKELRETYDKNEVAGDLRFLNKEILLNATIDKINSGIRNQPFLTLRDGNTYFQTQAKFKAPDMARIANLSKGDKIRLICIGGGETGSVPFLKDCQFLDEAVPSLLKKVESALTQPYQKDVELTGMQTTFIQIKVFDDTLKKTSMCGTDAETCRKVFRKMVYNSKHWDDVIHPELKRRGKEIFSSPPYPAKPPEKKPLPNTSKGKSR